MDASDRAPMPLTTCKNTGLMGRLALLTSSPMPPHLGQGPVAADGYDRIELDQIFAVHKRITPLSATASFCRRVTSLEAYRA
eukprot:scaffold4118_cov257-Pinguiococcus_pyrenoidosus.AAC.5